MKGIRRALACVSVLLASTGHADRGAASSQPLPCGADFSVEKTVRHFSSLSGTDDVSTVAKLGMQYYQCRAFVTGDWSGCNTLKTFIFRDFKRGGGVKSKDRECRHRYYDVRWIHDLVADAPNRTPGCMDDFEYSELYIKLASRAGICEMVDKHFSDPEVLCTQLEVHFPGQFKPDICRRWFKSVNGDVAACEAATEPTEHSQCLSLAGFYKAYHAHDIKACGDSALCRVMYDGDIHECDQFARQLKDAVCSAPR